MTLDHLLEILENLEALEILRKILEDVVNQGPNNHTTNLKDAKSSG